MKIIREYNEFKTEVIGYGKNAISVRKQLIDDINNKIEKYLYDVYGEYGFFNVRRYPNRNDVIPLGDYGFIKNRLLSLLINNRTVFSRVIGDYGLKNEEEFYNFILNNMDEIYHYNGNFFKNHSRKIVENAWKKGKSKEELSISLFEIFLHKKLKENNKSTNIVFKEPNTAEDAGGVDMFVNINGRRKTIQVKPLLRYTEINSNIQITIGGSMSVNTNYLLLYTDDNRYYFTNLEKKIETSSDSTILVTKNNFYDISE